VSLSPEELAKLAQLYELEASQPGPGLLKEKLRNVEGELRDCAGCGHVKLHDPDDYLCYECRD
jgi:hypothetical protein